MTAAQTRSMSSAWGIERSVVSDSLVNAASAAHRSDV